MQELPRETIAAREELLACRSYASKGLPEHLDHKHIDFLFRLARIQSLGRFAEALDTAGEGNDDKS